MTLPYGQSHWDYLPEEMKVIIYKYEHALKFKPALEDIILSRVPPCSSFRNDNDDSYTVVFWKHRNQKTAYLPFPGFCGGDEGPLYSYRHFTPVYENKDDYFSFGCHRNIWVIECDTGRHLAQFVYYKNNKDLIRWRRV